MYVCGEFVAVVVLELSELKPAAKVLSDWVAEGVGLSSDSIGTGTN